MSSSKYEAQEEVERWRWDLKRIWRFPNLLPFTLSRQPPERHHLMIFHHILHKPSSGHTTQLAKVVIMWLYLVQMCKTLCFDHNLQGFVVLYFGHLLVYQHSFDNFFVRRVHRCCVPFFCANQWNRLGGVRKKIGFQHFAKLRERNMEAEMAWPIPGDSGKFTECVDLRFWMCDKFCGRNEPNSTVVDCSAS